MPPILLDMAMGEAVAIGRGHDRRIAEQSHLPAMGMPGKSEGHPVRYIHKQIRLMYQQHNGRIIRDLRQGADKIIQPLAAIRPAALMHEGDLVSDARQPEGLAILLQPDRLVLDQGHPGSEQGGLDQRRPGTAAHGLPVDPPVMVALNAITAQRSLELCQPLRHLIHQAGAQITPGPQEITQHHDDIGLQGIGGGDHRIQPFQRRPWLADMQVADGGNGQGKIRRPLRQAGRMVAEGQADARLIAKGIAAQPRQGESGSSHGFQHSTACQHRFDPERWPTCLCSTGKASEFAVQG